MGPWGGASNVSCCCGRCFSCSSPEFAPLVLAGCGVRVESGRSCWLLLECWAKLTSSSFFLESFPFTYSTHQTAGSSPQPHRDWRKKMLFTSFGASLLDAIPCTPMPESNNHTRPSSVMATESNFAATPGALASGEFRGKGLSRWYERQRVRARHSGLRLLFCGQSKGAGGPKRLRTSTPPRAAGEQGERRGG